MSRISIKLAQMMALLKDREGYITGKELEEESLFSGSVIGDYTRRGYWPTAFELKGKLRLYDCDEVRRYLMRGIRLESGLNDFPCRTVEPTKPAPKSPSRLKTNFLTRLLSLVEGLSDPITVREMRQKGLLCSGSTLKYWRNKGCWPEPVSVVKSHAIYDKEEVKATISRELEKLQGKSAQSTEEKQRQEKDKKRRALIERIETAKNNLYSADTLYDTGIFENLEDAEFALTAHLLGEEVENMVIYTKEEVLRYLRDA